MDPNVIEQWKPVTPPIPTTIQPEQWEPTQTWSPPTTTWTARTSTLAPDNPLNKYWHFGTNYCSGPWSNTSYCVVTSVVGFCITLAVLLVIIISIRTYLRCTGKTKEDLKWSVRSGVRKFWGLFKSKSSAEKEKAEMEAARAKEQREIEMRDDEARAQRGDVEFGRRPSGVYEEVSLDVELARAEARAQAQAGPSRAPVVQPPPAAPREFRPYPATAKSIVMGAGRYHGRPPASR